MNINNVNNTNLNVYQKPFPSVSMRIPKKALKTKVIGLGSLYSLFKTFSTPNSLKSDVVSTPNMESIINSTKIKLTYDVYSSSINTPIPKTINNNNNNNNPIPGLYYYKNSSKFITIKLESSGNYTINDNYLSITNDDDDLLGVNGTYTLLPDLTLNLSNYNKSIYKNFIFSSDYNNIIATVITNPSNCENGDECIIEDRILIKQN